MKLLTPKTEDVDLKFIFLLMQTIKINSETHKRYYLSKYSKLKIFLPPLPVQKKIVSTLEKIEVIKGWRKESDKLTKDYLKSVFAKMFLKKGFPIKRLDEITEIIMGQSPPGDSYNEIGKGTPFFQGKAEFGVRYPSVKKWTIKPSKISNPVSILISVRAPVGTVNLCKIRCCIGRGLASIKPREEIDLEYLYSFLTLNEDKISDMGTGSTFKAITSNQLKSIIIPLPPLPLQEKFASIVKQVEKLKEYQKQSEKEINNLFNALMQKAFRGEL